MSISQRIGKAVGCEGLPLSNFTTELKLRRPYASLTISRLKAGRWRSTKLGHEKMVLPFRKMPQHHRLPPAPNGLPSRVLLKRRLAEVVQVAISVQTPPRGGAAST